MVDDETTTATLYAPDAALVEVSVDAGDGAGPTTYRSDVTGKVSGVDARHKRALIEAGFATERTSASMRDTASKAASS